MTFLIVLLIVIALLFDVINGFHDSANSIATVVSTRVLSPLTAVFWAAFFNLIAMFVFLPRVADTISKIIIISPDDPIYLLVIFSGLMGGILWDLWTWWLKLPTSSSHALIGGLTGAGLAYGGFETIRLEVIYTALEFIIISPLLGYILGSTFIFFLYWLFQNKHRKAVNHLFKRGQLFSAALYSLGHGANDAQKTMGVILALLLAAGWLDPHEQLALGNPKTGWIIISCHGAMALGTALGGWRIVKTMGMRIIKLRSIDGFCAETAGACSLFFATHYGIPVSTTHTIIGSIVGVGTITSLAKVRWGIATQIVWAWVLTIPGSALIALSCFFLSKWIIAFF